MTQDKSVLKWLGKTENIICIALVVIIGMTIASMFFLRNKDQLEKAYVYDLSEGWVYEDGSSVDLSTLKKGLDEYTISRVITTDEQHDEALCFYTKNIYFEVYCDGVKVYGYHPETYRIFGKAYGVYMHHIEMPIYDRQAELSIVVEPIYKDSANFIRDMVFMDGGTFVRKELFSDLMRFIMCLIITLYGFIIFVLGVMGENLKEQRTEIMSIGAFSVVASAFIMSGTQIFPLFTGNPTIVHFMDYMGLMLLTYPAVVYAAHATGNKESKFVTAAGIMTIANFILQIVLTLAGVSDYHQMLHLTHVVILVAVVMVLILIVKGIREAAINKRIYKFLVVAFGITALTGGYDIFIYIANPNQRRDGGTFQFGMFAFILLLGTYEITVILELTRKGQKAELMEEIAYHDVLTGLWNRQAFMREEFEMRNEKEGVYTFIMFDVNSLKQMNDQFGHSFGDELIKAAAQTIDNSFGERGMCFRTGGDEFFVIFKASAGAKSFEMACKLFEHNIAEYNEKNKLPLPLSIAYGYDEYHCGKDKPEDIERVADNRMYEMKVSMKAARA